MTRTTRKLSSSGVYHVMLRGINKQNIFEDREDRIRFKTGLSDAKAKDGIKLFGYCLMTNHVHLMIKAESGSLSRALKSIAGNYGHWFNKKYERCGSLFQDRFKSEPIETDAYWLVALRYIHQNPLKAGMCRRLDDFQWSSYRDYLGSGDGLADTAEMLEMFGTEPSLQVKFFKDFMEEESTQKFADFDDVVRFSEKDTQEKMLEISGAKNVSEFQALSPEAQKQAAHSMRAAGISIRQIVRLTGMPFGLVRKV